MSGHVFVLGGARSGKSAYGERLALALGERPAYLATSQAFDAEMQARIDRHRADRDPRFMTIEAPLDLVGALEKAEKEHDAILVDCLTLWLSNLMAADRDIKDSCDGLVGFLAGADQSRILIVSNEVGLGIVPDNAAARAFRDHAGHLHQAIARVVPQVVFVAAGLPMAMKGTLPEARGPIRSS